MNESQSLARNVGQRLFVLDCETEGVARKIFDEHRRKTLAAYLKNIRLWHHVALYNYLFQKPVSVDLPSLEFCNVAAMILTYSSEDHQRLFLAAGDEGRARMVQAVIDDGGIYDENEKWQEIWE